MPKWSDDHPQKALLWERTGTDDNGQPVVSAVPVELDVRWEGSHREVSGPQGTPIALNAVVTVDREIQIGGMMWLGSLDDLPQSGIPDGGLEQVVSYESITDLKAQVQDRTVGLIRWNDTLPV